METAHVVSPHSLTLVFLGEPFQKAFCSGFGDILQIFLHKHFIDQKTCFFLIFKKYISYLLISPTYSFCINMTTNLVQGRGFNLRTC